MTNQRFRLGRFEYNQEIGASFGTVYRQRSSGRILAPCNSGWLLDKDSFCLYNDKTLPEARVLTELKDDGSSEPAGTVYSTVAAGTPPANPHLIDVVRSFGRQSQGT